MPPGDHRNITGNTALALGLVAASVRRSCRWLLGAYPIAPASDILHELRQHKRFGITDPCRPGWDRRDRRRARRLVRRIDRRHHHQQGPGVALKERDHLAGHRALELPLVIVDVQRAGPSTGMPTKTEQADLNMALFGRHGEAPAVVIAPSSRPTASTRPSKRPGSR